MIDIVFESGNPENSARDIKLHGAHGENRNFELVTVHPNSR